MATIVVLRHEFDLFRKWSLPRPNRPRYMLDGVLDVLRCRGHKVLHSNRPAAVPCGDMLFLHVDCTFVPDEYLDAAAGFPVAVNGAVRDISKRRISSLLLSRGDDWDGAVFVKSNLNTRGIPEEWQNWAARVRLRRPPYPDLKASAGYVRYESMAAVPNEVWDDPACVVERFVCEPVNGLFAVRNYVFCGGAERCSMHLSPDPVVKASGIVRSVQTDVPDELREIRRSMGFDYGKFDFVMVDGRPVLLDVNKTVGAVENPNLRDRIRTGNIALADGVEGMLARSRREPS